MSTNERTPVTEDSERCKTWDESLDLSCSVPVGQWLPSDRKPTWPRKSEGVAGRLENEQRAVLIQPNPVFQFASTHLRKMVLNLSLPDNYGYVALTAMSTGWLLVVRRPPFQTLFDERRDTDGSISTKRSL